MCIRDRYEDRKEKTIKNNVDAADILTQEETIEKAKKYGQELLDDVSVLKYDNGDPITDYLNFKLKYDALPRVISDAEFENEKVKKQVWYRGVASTSDTVSYTHLLVASSVVPLTVTVDLFVINPSAGAEIDNVGGIVSTVNVTDFCSAAFPS